MKNLLPAILILFLLAACTSADKDAPKGAEQYFQEGEMFFEKGLYEDAIASWEKVRESFYSPELTNLAELKIAEAHFLAKQYPEAAAAYGDFLKQNPGHERTSQILFQMGLAHYQQILDMDRDQTATHNAITAFNNFLAQFPDDPNAEEAKRIIRDCRERLAAHELYVGHFYLRARQPLAAIQRLEEVITSFPEFSERDRVYFTLGRSYLAAGRREAAAETFATLGREFPQSELVAKARKVLEKSP